MVDMPEESPLMKIIPITIWVIQHEDEILEKLPPEKQAQMILAISFMRSGLDKIKRSLQEENF